MEEIRLKELFNFIKNYYSLRKKKGYKKARDLFPRFEVMERFLKIDYITLKKRLRELENMGVIQRKVSQYYLQKDKKKTTDLILEPKKESSIKQNPDIENIKIIVLKSIMFIVGSIATFMSVYYTQLWFVNMLDVSKSFLLSICMVGFSIVAFEAIILFKQNNQKTLVVVFSILWVIVLLFSMTSTVAGQLNLELKKRIIEDTKNIVENNDMVLYKQYYSIAEDSKIDLKSKRKERQFLTNQLDKFNYDNTEDRKEYKNVNYRIYLKNIVIDKLKKQIEDNQNKIESLLKNNVKINVEAKKDFFEWLEEVFKLDKNIFKFILFLFPAIWIDVIAPLSFAIILFYRRRRNDSNRID